MPTHTDRFALVSDFELRGDQARAISELHAGLDRVEIENTVTRNFFQSLEIASSRLSAPRSTRIWSFRPSGDSQPDALKKPRWLFSPVAPPPIRVA